MNEGALQKLKYSQVILFDHFNSQIFSDQIYIFHSCIGMICELLLNQHCRFECFLYSLFQN